jgi:hypothetical protein
VSIRESAGPGHGQRDADRVTTGTGSPGGWWRWLVLLLAAAAIVVRAPVYFSTPSFWAEEGAYHFAIAWERPPLAALTYQRAGYLNLWANLATTTAARLVRAGVISLTHAPFVTVTFAFAVQLLLVALIAWSRAPFWGGPGRRIVGIVAVLAGAMTDEIWLTTINSQHWLVLASVLLLLEPPDGSCARRWATIAILLVTGLSSPVAAVLLPLYAWRAWRTGTRAALEQAAVVALCALVQAWCLWSAVQIGEPLPDRAKGLDFGVFAAAAWMRTIVVPTLGADAARRFVGLLIRAGGPGAVSNRPPRARGGAARLARARAAPRDARLSARWLPADHDLLAPRLRREQGDHAQQRDLVVALRLRARRARALHVARLRASRRRTAAGRRMRAPPGLRARPRARGVSLVVALEDVVAALARACADVGAESGAGADDLAPTMVHEARRTSAPGELTGAAHKGMICSPRNTCTPDRSSAAAPIQRWTTRARASRSMRRETSAASP